MFYPTNIYLVSNFMKNVYVNMPLIILRDRAKRRVKGYTWFLGEQQHYLESFSAHKPTGTSCTQLLLIFPDLDK